MPICFSGLVPLEYDKWVIEMRVGDETKGKGTAFIQSA